jgi:adenosylhomocysteine nucleosidase
MSSDDLLLLVAPTKRELGGLSPGQDGALLVATTGLGKQAAPALDLLLQTYPVRRVVSLGFAGALTPQTRAGSLVVCNSLLASGREPPPPLSAEGEMLDWTMAWLDRVRLPYHYGGLYTSAKLLLTPERKRRAGLASGADVADMEGYWLAETAAAHGVPFLALRAVLDGADYTLPKLAEEIAEDQGRHEIRHTLQYVFTFWSHGPRLLPLALRSRRAQGTLRQAVQSLMPEMLREMERAAS